MTMDLFFDKADFNLISFFAIDFSKFSLLAAESGACVILAFALLRKVSQAQFLWPLTSVAVLSTVSVLVHFFLLPQHAFNHDFPILKFAFPMGLLVLTLAPAAASIVVAKVSSTYCGFRPNACQTIFSILACGAAVSGIYFSMTRYDTPQQHFPPISGEIGALGKIIARTVTYEDVVFSPQIDMPRMSLESGFSRKVVYRSSDLDGDLARFTAHLCEPFNLVVVSDELDQPKRATAPSEVWRDSGLVFYRWRNLKPAKAGCVDKRP
jgi:hypothetical protein